MKRNKQRILAFLLAFLLTGTLIGPVLAAEGGGENTEIHICTDEDLISLSRNCSVDGWSVGKTVYLDADIDLEGSKFLPIPIFNGTFYGQGHTISGFSISGSGDARGFFRYVQSAATIQDLTVRGLVTPSDRKDSIGGLVGVNSGKLLNCSFQGNVKAGSNVGGVVGCNKPAGQLINCTYSGTLQGEHYVGGIVGLNEGSVIHCQNDGNVNITEVKTTVTLYEVDLSAIRSTESVPACTDIGGIAGASAGILQSCTNNGDVGYEHVGYNVGGIAGRQSGWLDSCANNGTIRGRKDVGGICGQMEPRLTLRFDSSSLNDLWNELDTLQALMDKAISDAEGVSDSISTQMDGITGSADEVKNAASDLSDVLSGWTDENIETINDVSARISWTIDRLEPIADSVDAALGQIQKSANLAGDALNKMDVIGNLSKEALDNLRLALDRVQNSAGLASVAVEQLRNALQDLYGTLGDSGAMSAAMDGVKTAVDDLMTAFGAMADAFDDLWNAAGQLHDSNGENSNNGPDSGQNGEHFNRGNTASSQPGESEISSNEGGETADDGNGTGDSGIDIPAWSRNDVGWTEVLDALGEMSSAAAQIQSALASLRNALDGVGSVANNILGETLEDIAAAAGTLDSSFQMLNKAAGHVENALKNLSAAVPHGGNVSALLQKAVETFGDACNQLRQAGDTFSDVMSELADKPKISFKPIGDTIEQKSNTLDDAMSGLGDAMQRLNDTMLVSSNILLADMRAINNQFGKVINVLRRHTNSEKEEDKELLEDVSDQATETDEDAGRITNAKNNGAVEGDVNVAGIVGSMAIEYDYDPEDDLTTSGDRSLNFHYQVAALTQDCVNNGEVSGKKDYVGGIVGRMDLGTVSQCESYAPVKSSGGDYVGGIAGAAWSTIRDCWSRCALSGNDYIGGVAGLGKTVIDCRSLVEIDEGAAYLGAVLGYMEEDGKVSENLFTHDTLNGIGGISYLGQAEPVDFGTLSQNAPDCFTKFRLVFRAEGQEVAAFDFSYGDALVELPEIPAKEGYSGNWPDMNYGFLTFSRTLDAEYTTCTTALTALGDPPRIVVEGTFSSDTTIHAYYGDGDWTDSRGVPHTGTVYTVEVIDPDTSVSSFQTQYKLSDGAIDGTVWVKTSKGWEQRDAEIDGTYLVFQADGDSVTFTVQERFNRYIFVVLVALGGVAAVAIFAFIGKKRRKAKENNVFTGVCSSNKHVNQ